MINNLDSLKLVEPLDLRITTKTFDSFIDYEIAANRDILDKSFKKSHQKILLRTIKSLGYISNAYLSTEVNAKYE